MGIQATREISTKQSRTGFSIPIPFLMKISHSYHTEKRFSSAFSINSSKQHHEHFPTSTDLCKGWPIEAGIQFICSKSCCICCHRCQAPETSHPAKSLQRFCNMAKTLADFCVKSQFLLCKLRTACLCKYSVVKPHKT